jgi:type IV pilus assembly protein PilB
MGSYTDVERGGTCYSRSTAVTRGVGTTPVRRTRSREANESAVAAKAALVPDLSVAEPRTRLGDVLVNSGVVTRDALEEASQQPNGRRLGTLLMERGVVGEEDVTRALSEQLHVPVVDLRDASPQPAATALIAPPDAHSHDVLPLVFADGALTVAVADPLNTDVTALLRSLPVREVHIALGVPSQLRNRVNQTYSALSAVSGDIEAFQATEALAVETVDATLEGAVDANAPIVQVVNKIVTQALRDRASDVHIEPSEDRVRVRFRVDGALNEVVELPGEMGQALVSRIKIMADMNIVEKRRPQDGQFEINIDGRALDVRVSTTSTIWGEKAVLRLLDRTRSLYALSELGMPPDSEALYSRLVNSPYGMVIVGGPTGSGKTTTLYATLSEINRPDINVMTIEDPVEYIFKKVNQIQIHEQAGMTFATGLKSILRQDPDVILVGEIRDVETARIAVQSALTGHRVFSSVHAIDAVSSLYRLLDMGIEPFLITSAIVGVVAQRLVRRICTSCSAPFEPSLSELTLYEKLGGTEKNVWVRGTGCQFCSSTGYFDRVGVYEVLAITDEIRQCVVDGHPPRAARELAAQQGLRTLQAEAIRMVESNVTTMEEVVKHVVVAEEF